MKYCEKCGNKLKEDSLFCEKCGTKILKDDKKEKEEKIKIEEDIHEDYYKYQPIPKKNGKGKLILSIILNIILIIATILFLVLWLTKSSNDCSNNSTTKPDETEKTKKDDNSVVGKWEQNVEYKKGNEVIRRTYGMIELKSDKTFNSVFYDKDDLTNSERLNGTYTTSSSNSIVYLSYKEEGKNETATLYITDGKMCIGSSNCEDYLVKDSYNNKVVIYSDDIDVDYSSVEYIDYNDYQNYMDDKETFIVVVVHNGCSWCEKYESIVEDINKYFTTPVYFYENDGNLGISATPTTLVIKDGELVNKYEGYTTYDNIKSILEDDGIN